MKIPFYRHPLKQDDLKDVSQVIDSLFIGTGTIAKSVEEQIGHYFDGKNALLTNSWTNGALIALLALNLEPEDEVIIPAMTFIASANIVELVHAKPVFTDVDPDTLLITPQHVMAALTPKTKIVMPVNLYGQICDIKGIREALDKAGRADVLIFEDSAHSFEALRDGEKTGTHSDLAAFSFYATKNITCGEGGAVITKHDHLYKEMLKTRTHGMSATALNRYAGGGYNHWEMECLGGKANMPDLLAAYLPRQIEQIDTVLKTRIDVAQKYRNAFQDSPLRFQHIEKSCVSAEHLFVFHVPPANRDEAIVMLNEAGIAVTVNYRSVPTRTYYKNKYGFSEQSFPVSYEWGEGCIALPLYPGLPSEEQEYIIKIVREKIYPLCN